MHLMLTIVSLNTFTIYNHQKQCKLVVIDAKIFIFLNDVVILKRNPRRHLLLRQITQPVIPNKEEKKTAFLFFSF